MPRPPSADRRKHFEMDQDLLNAYERAKIEARERGDEDFPQTLKEFLNRAAREWLEKRKTPTGKAPAKK